MPDSVVELTKILRAEVLLLSQQNDAVKKLTRSFHNLLRVLQQNSARQLADSPRTKSLSGSARSLAVLKNDLGNGTSVHLMGSNWFDRLRRACRIALMETEEAASVEEICSRITRRGSYSFENLHYATEAITRTLDLMAEEGEAINIANGYRRCWKRARRNDLT